MQIDDLLIDSYLNEIDVLVNTLNDEINIKKGRLLIMYIFLKNIETNK